MHPRHCTYSWFCHSVLYIKIKVNTTGIMNAQSKENPPVSLRHQRSGPYYYCFLAGSGFFSTTGFSIFGISLLAFLHSILSALAASLQLILALFGLRTYSFLPGSPPACANPKLNPNTNAANNFIAVSF